MTKALRRAAAFARASLAEERGGVVITLAVALSALLGMVALGTEITFVVYKHRQMQSAADSAAIGSAVALAKGYPADFKLEGKAIAATGGFVNGTNGVTVTINKPPATGNNTANASAVEVIIAQPQTLKLTSILSSAVFTVTARSVAIKGASGNICLLTTDTTNATGMDVSNGVTINLNQCGIAVNAGGAAAVSVIGGAKVNAGSLSVKGQTTVNNGGSINLTAPNTVQINQPVMADPYAAVTTSTPSGCNWTNRSLGWSASTQTLNPGTYCEGLSINSATVVMNPGVYYIKGGSFNIGGSTVTGSGITIILTRNASAYATASLSNGSNITLGAPTSGTYSGILFFSDRLAPTSLTSNFATSPMNLTGAIYLPRHRVTYSNGVTTSSTCTQLIAWRVTFSGGASFNSNCASAGTRAIGGAAATVAE